MGDKTIKSGKREAVWKLAVPALILLMRTAVVFTIFLVERNETLRGALPLLYIIVLGGLVVIFRKNRRIVRNIWLTLVIMPILALLFLGLSQLINSETLPMLAIMIGAPLTFAYSKALMKIIYVTLYLSVHMLSLFFLWHYSDKKI